MKKEVQKLPKGALRFVEMGKGCCAFAETKEDQKPRLNMVAYSGKPIKGHWYWGDLVLALDGIKMAAPKIPVLEEHWTNQRIGFTSKLLVDNENGVRVDPDKTQFLDNEVANRFIKDSSEGFPFQSSVYIKPEKIQRLSEKEEIEVNGFKFKGPGTVFLKSKIKEVSVCVFGWDSKTESSAFSRTETEEVEFFSEGGDEQILDEKTFNNDDSREEVTEIMDLKELKAKHPELVEELANEVKASMQKEFDEKEKASADKFAEMNKRIDDLSDKLAESDKENTLNREELNREKAERIYAERLSNSNVPERFHEKVKNMVRFTKFVEKEKLDVEKFNEALDAEIKDWEDRGATTEVMGLSTAQDKDDAPNDVKLKEENKSLADDLLERVGQKQE